jgi:type IV pilus assembly protein PilE
MKNEKGFTLIELMIVVAIIGIIASLAVTSYNDSTRKTRRSDAKTSLTDLAAQFERCYTANGQYTTTTAPAKTCGLVTTAGALTPAAAASGKGFYTITVALTANTFTLTATPTGFTDADCASFTLSNTGAQTPSGNTCW